MLLPNLFLFMGNFLLCVDVGLGLVVVAAAAAVVVVVAAAVVSSLLLLSAIVCNVLISPYQLLLLDDADVAIHV